VNLLLLDCDLESVIPQFGGDQGRDGVLSRRRRAMLDRRPALDALTQL
jgi:hypothetical protein